MGKEYHVSIGGNDKAEGSVKYPFRTISKAAAVAVAGDKVIVHKGEYREWVKPENGGTSNITRIEYEAAKGEKVVIKGSERIQNWKQTGGGIWKAVIANTLFGDYNPYRESLWGDWFVYPEDNSVHAGDVYLNGISFYEAKSLEDLRNPSVRTEGKNKLLYPGDTGYQWYAQAEEEKTIIYADFKGADPNKELAEINVRKCCFFPEKTGRNYISVRGFEMAHAACPWIPPTAYQQGLLGTNWSKGWIIENNIIHDAKCSGISIGKDDSSGHNLCSAEHRKAGYQYQMEAVFHALQTGWCKEKIGSHIIRNNIIYDCGQNGIVGHMGCAFSKIYDNHIYRIGVKREFFGWEIAGIKFHAAIDVQICHNNIHHCILGTWLDWQAQGTRVSRNLYYANDRDIMFEVTHGPHMVDNNIFASEFNLDNSAQGGAYVHNLFCGAIYRIEVLNRATPYHVPHSTQVAGTTFVYSGDDRVYNNIFVGGSQSDREGAYCGTGGYDDCPATWDEYVAGVTALGLGDLENFEKVQQAVYINQNAYFNGAIPFKGEKEKYVSESKLSAAVFEEDGITWLEMDVAEDFLEFRGQLIDTKVLGRVRITEMPYEDPEGNPIVIDTDYFGEKRDQTLPIGPFTHLKKGKNRIKLWEQRKNEI